MLALFEKLISLRRAYRVTGGRVIEAPTRLVGEHAEAIPVRLQEHAVLSIQQCAVLSKNLFEYRAPMKKAQANGSPS